MRVTRRDFMKLLMASGLAAAGRLARLEARGPDQVDDVDAGDLHGVWHHIGMSYASDDREIAIWVDGERLDLAGEVSWETTRTPADGWVLAIDDEQCEDCLRAGSADWIGLFSERRTAEQLAGMFVGVDLADGWEKSITVGRLVPVDQKNKVGIECAIDLGIMWDHVHMIDQDDGEWVTADKGETWTRVL